MALTTRSVEYPGPPQIRSPFPSSPRARPPADSSCPHPVSAHMAWQWMGDISIHFSSPSFSSFSSPYSDPAVPTTLVLAALFLLLANKRKGKVEKRRRRRRRSGLCESEVEKVSECHFLARVLLSARFSRPTVLLDFPSGLRARLNGHRCPALGPEPPVSSPLGSPRPSPPPSSWLSQSAAASKGNTLTPAPVTERALSGARRARPLAPRCTN